MTTTASSAAGVRWDLSDLYSGHDDPRIEATLRECHDGAKIFAERLRPWMENPETITPERLHHALQELEILYESLGRVGTYAGLLYAADTSNAEYQDLHQKVEQRSTNIRNLLIFLNWNGSSSMTRRSTA